MKRATSKIYLEHGRPRLKSNVSRASTGYDRFDKADIPFTQYDFKNRKFKDGIRWDGKMARRDDLLADIKADLDLAIELGDRHRDQLTSAHLDSILTGKIARANPDKEIFDYYEDYLVSMAHKSDDYLRGERRGLTQLKDWKPDLRIADIDRNFVQSFWLWVGTSDVKHNSKRNYTFAIKRFLHWLVDEDDFENHRDIHRAAKWKVEPAEPTGDKVRLTWDEIWQFAKVLVKGETERLIRDAFVINCFWGLRFGDWHRAEVVGNRLQGTTGKKKKRFRHDLYAWQAELLAGYSMTPGRLPKLSRNAKPHPETYNQYIKILAKRAGVGLDEYFDGNEGKLMPRWSGIGSHTCRRTYARLSERHLRDGAERLKIQMTHGDGDQSRDYIGDQFEENLQILQAAFGFELAPVDWAKAA